MFSELNPFVRYAAKSTYFLDFPVVAKDCRLIYVISGVGNFRAFDEDYPLTAGTLMYYPPATPYHISSDDGLLFYTVNFDFTQLKRTDSNVPFVPVSHALLEGEIFDEGIPEFFKKCIFAEHAEFAEPLLRQIYEETLRKDACADAVKSAKMKLLLVDIYRCALAKRVEASLVLTVKECIKADLTLNNVELAKRLSYHPYYLNAVFKGAEGISLHKYVMHERLAKACELITASSESFERIAEICGFSSASHLSAAVGKEYGVSPSKMRRL